MLNDTSVTLLSTTSSSLCSLFSNSSTHTLDSTQATLQQSRGLLKSPREAWWGDPGPTTSTAVLEERSDLPGSSHFELHGDVSAQYGSAVASLQSTPRDSTVAPGLSSHDASPGRSQRSSVIIELPPHLIGRPTTDISQVYVDVPSHLSLLTQTHAPAWRTGESSNTPPM
ncbi:hypothetical protein I317_00290 [Kwoniella heveanensis CBS 569]|nr:hypothetical protein I317_00290 [Kwoniella heveanensis CBS 569]